MLRMLRRVGSFAPPACRLSVLALVLVAAVIASPVGTVADSARVPMALSVPLVARSYAGTPAIGALFLAAASGARSHFCTATVVHSPRHDLVVTAAHCLAGVTARPRDVSFVPGYHDGTAPYGVWPAVRVVVDAAWALAASPDDDVAFMVMASGRTGTEIEDVTGAEELGIGASATTVVQVTGYPDTQERPVICQNRTTRQSAGQMRFDCGGFTDGTSGGPILVNVSPATGDGTVIGVIGGFQQGGYTPGVSYSPIFGPNVAALYAAAIADS